MSKSIVFRTAISGYNKKDVNEYLISKSQETEKAMEQKNAQLASLNEKLSELSQNHDNRISQVQSVLENDISVLEDKINALSELAVDIIAKLCIADEEIARNAEYSIKAAKYDKLAATLSDILSASPRDEEYQLSAAEDRTELKIELAGALQELNASVESLKQKIDSLSSLDE